MRSHDSLDQSGIDSPSTTIGRQVGEKHITKAHKEYVRGRSPGTHEEEDLGLFYQAIWALSWRISKRGARIGR